MQGRQLLERRARMLTLKSQGVKITKIVEDFAGEYNVSQRALWYDWNKRERWASDIVRLEDPTLVRELIQGLMQVLPNAWYEYKTNPNPSVKLGALKLARDTYIDLIGILQSTGYIEKLPEELKFDITWREPKDDSS